MKNSPQTTTYHGLHSFAYMGHIVLSSAGKRIHWRELKSEGDRPVTVVEHARQEANRVFQIVKQ